MPTTVICAARMTEELGREQRQREPRVADHDPWHADVPRRGTFGRRPPRRPRRSPAARTRAPSAFSPRSATNTDPRVDLPRVVGVTPVHGTSSAAAAGHVGRVRARASSRIERLQQLANGHGVRPRELTRSTPERSTTVSRLDRRAGRGRLLDDDAGAVAAARSGRAATACAAHRARSGREIRQRRDRAACAPPSTVTIARRDAGRSTSAARASSLAARDEHRRRRVDRSAARRMPQRGLGDPLEDRRGDRRRRTAAPCAASRPRRRS